MAFLSAKKLDLRLVAGLLLVILSILGVSFLLSRGTNTTGVYVAAGALSTGHKVSENDLEVIQVALGDASDAYLAQGELESGYVTTHPIASGELIHLSSLSPAKKSTTTTVVVELATALPRRVQPGSTVDLWAAMAIGQGVYATPEVLVSGAEFVREVKPEGITAITTGTSVEVLIPADSVAGVLEAQANKDALSVVPSTAKSTQKTQQ